MKLIVKEMYKKEYYKRSFMEKLLGWGYECYDHLPAHVDITVGTFSKHLSGHVILTPYSFDVLLMIDFIEHLEKERGIIILEQAKQVARKVVLLLTPLWWQDNAVNVNNPDLWCYGNKYDYHKSLWTLEDFAGWDRITGIKNLDNYFVGAYNTMRGNNDENIYSNSIL